jgi:hypothetical protein
MPGESLGSIANQLNSTITAIVNANQVTLKAGTSSALYPGELILVPIDLVTPLPTKAVTATPTSTATP